jgi:hypothetical protein
MSQPKRFIPNPNKITNTEQAFIEGEKRNVPSLDRAEDDYIKEIYKGRMISMPDSFYKKLNVYLKKHPTEGSKSSFIVRVAEYIEKKE